MFNLKYIKKGLKSILFKLLRIPFFGSFSSSFKGKNTPRIPNQNSCVAGDRKTGGTKRTSVVIEVSCHIIFSLRVCVCVFLFSMTRKSFSFITKLQVINFLSGISLIYLRKTFSQKKVIDSKTNIKIHYSSINFARVFFLEINIRYVENFPK